MTKEKLIRERVVSEAEQEHIIADYEEMISEHTAHKKYHKR